MSYASIAHRAIPVRERKSIVTSRGILQSNSNLLNKQPATPNYKLCELFVQDVCKDPSCLSAHNAHLKKRRIDEKKKILRECGIAGRISGKNVCFFYTTGDVCQKVERCPFLHDDSLRQKFEMKEASKSTKVDIAKSHMRKVDKIKVNINSIEQPSNWDDPAIYAHWDELTESVKVAKPATAPKRVKVNKAKVNAIAQVPGWDDPLIYSHWDKVRENRVLTPPTSPHNSSKLSFSALLLNPSYKKKTHIHRRNVIPQTDLSSKQVLTPGQNLTPPTSPSTSNNASLTSHNAGYKTEDGYEIVTAINGPTIQPWDTIPSHWESWARRNLEPADHAAIRRFIENGMLDHGIIPGELLSIKCKNAHADAEFPKFMLLPYEIREMIWKQAIKGEAGYEVRVEFKYDMEFDNVVNPRFKPWTSTSGLLRACYESRKISRKTYSRAFPTYCSPAITYINYKRDGLFLNVRNPPDWFIMIPHIEAKCVGLIRTLILPIRDFIKGNAEVTKFIFGFISDCRNLTHLHLIAGDGKEDAVVNFKDHENKIRRVVHSYFKKLHPNRKMGLPKVILRFIPATTAHMYKIDGLVW